MKVLINDCYGSFCISEEALNLYNLKRINNCLEPVKNGHNLVRHDKLLVEVYEEIGLKMNSRHCTIKIEEIDDKYEKYYKLNEYDGAEELIILYNKYIVDEILKLICNCKESNETIDKIKQIIEENS